ncbi:EVE domain-containing protein [Geomonas anaerohicana]|uniref:EVE domain-containing protein n=1 Tax=Geomonas anaerohicana TaxID=2798583 RepID=A0ABS0YC30_9BACT|nr:EVE domain-containing protein [Geomonas anaerohicana]MBJ6749889.1 EVE domain-containing protein [Geomonas anaerohicana]
MPWIFQGNPKDFDIDGYLSAFSRVAWTVRQGHFKDDIAIGDRVFFWRSKGGRKGPYGIVAIGTIASTPVIMRDHPEALPYWVTKPEEEVALRCWIDIDHCAISKGTLLSTEHIRGDELLCNLRILRLSQNTNYLISDEEGDRLLALYNHLTEDDRVIASFSWTIEGRCRASKVLDKSAFLHHGSGIPKDVRWFFLDRELEAGERVDVTLLADGKAYPAHIAMESQGTARTRLFWDSSFVSLLHKSFPEHLKRYQQDQLPPNGVVMCLERRDDSRSYDITFGAELPESLVVKDIEAEITEDAGPRSEGGTKEYFGKRYERDAINRRRAIEHHGLACKACGFNFERVYGERGSGFIEVHHVKPISMLKEKQQVDPKTDLVTLCSNCHKMIHRRPDNILTIAELKKLLSLPTPA